MSSSTQEIAQTIAFNAITATDSSGLLLLSAANVNGSHTLPDVVLSTNVPLLNVANTFAAGTIVASGPQSITQTWNSSGVTFEGLSLNITNTASAAASKSFVVKASGSAIFFVTPGGRAAVGSTSSPSARLVVDDSGNNRSGFSNAGLSVEAGGDTSSFYATYYRNQSAGVIMATRADRRVGVRTGTPLAELDVFNGSILLSDNSSTSTQRERGSITTAAVDNTDATRKYRIIYSAYDTAPREGFRIEASGSAPMISFYGATAIVKPTVSGAKGSNLALGSLMTALANLGLVTDSTTA